MQHAKRRGSQCVAQHGADAHTSPSPTASGVVFGRRASTRPCQRKARGAPTHLRAVADHHHPIPLNEQAGLAGPGGGGGMGGSFRRHAPEDHLLVGGEGGSRQANISRGGGGGGGGVWDPKVCVPKRARSDCKIRFSHCCRLGLGAMSNGYCARIYPHDTGIWSSP